ncbi:MAG TPA: response regulator [Rhizomicrobium sp.]|nr:response regulator [Rhizomicrobium sp.]
MSGETILLAEDETLVRMVAAEFLRDAGFNVVEAPDSDAALELLKSDPAIALLITDINMPGMNGYQLAEAGIALRPGLHLLMMTGYAEEPPPRIRALARFDIIRKPFDFDLLVKLVQSTLA